MLDWAITHQSDPFPCREALAKDPSSTSPRAAADIEGADTVDGEVATERTVPVPKLGLQPKLAPGLSNHLKEVDLVYHRLVLEVFLCHQNHSLNFTSCTVGILQPPGITTPLWHALISVHGVPARVHPRQRRIGPLAVLKTQSSRSHLGHATSSFSLV